ncbi:Rog3p [Lachancea thermotolerans CBS 6340]|uniref:KLTH0H12892p n=1 Tax=Lachancea thermotolerans (strain ATCC 56472 / CBS 6340 / NRRL Y-8284) TaxID=559295 RepID=C5E3F0_LACTC|nr:KLTH0H12892p [Lachancea thermotolerans CBS 6340]CAR30561.1 KLTH0H12892p [Lachancea thermotolerans CBS 6340]
MMGFSSSKGSKPPALFEIRIKSAEHDVIVVKGAPHEASSVLLSGTVVLSVSEPMQIKKLTLRMYGMLRLNLTTTYRGPKGPTERSFKYDKRFFEHVWDNINIQDYFHNLYDNYGSQRSILSKTNSFSTLYNLHNKAKSTTSLKSLGSGSSGNSHLLVKGNYEFPFSAILPGTLTESVEGLPNASVIYKIQATIERSKFATDLICKKHMRIIRTLTPDAVELSETMSVDNTWPNKVDYSISVPAKAIAIGSSTMIHILMVPLLKGLKLGPIKVTLVEYSSYCAPYGAGNTQERVVNRVKLSDPLNHSAASNSLQEDSQFQDKWEVDAVFNVPPSLSKCTQDCSILSNIKVRHKLKFVISLINPDGHVSELRASLPIQLFISPFVALGVRCTDSLDSSANISANSTDVEGDDDDMIFANSASELDLAALSSDTGQNNTTNVTAALMAPPNYESHIYDRLWSGISVENTPTTSGRQSPVGPNESSTLSSPQQVKELQEGLQKLHVQQSLSGNENLFESHGNGQPISPEGNGQPENGSRSNPPVDYFAMPVPRHVQSMMNMNTGLRSPTPMLSPGIDYLSRNNSFGPIPPSSKSDWKLNTLSRVPSYENAMKGDSLPIDLPPAYPNEDGEEPTYELERPKMAHQKSSGMHRTPSGNQLSHAALSRSNNSSSSSLPKFQLSRSNTGGSNISTNGGLGGGKNTTASKHFGFSMTPLGHKREQSSTSLKAENSPERASNYVVDGGESSPSSISRNGSLMNLKGLLRKKDK